jgi:Domain of unknown function (DUF4268)
MAMLGKLRTVDARDAWQHEAHQFTPWLAEHVGLLGEALGLELEVESTEVSVGDFNVDVVARETGSGRRLIVENQLEQTNHGHLGQILTYTSGTDPAYVVWIATRFRDEHRQALDWLNAHTEEGIDFFGVELELLQIDDSPLAPHFKVVAQPNEWAKTARHAASEGGTSELSLRYQRFLNDVLARYKKVRPHDTSTSRALPQSWLPFGAGRAGFGFVWSIAKKRMRVELYIDTGPTAKGFFDALEAQRDEIEATLGAPISWERLDARKSSRLAVYHDVPDAPPFEENEELKIWAVEMMVRWTAVLRPRIKALVA